MVKGMAIRISLSGRICLALWQFFVLIMEISSNSVNIISHFIEVGQKQWHFVFSACNKWGESVLISLLGHRLYVYITFSPKFGFNDTLIAFIHKRFTKQQILVYVIIVSLDSIWLLIHNKQELCLNSLLIVHNNYLIWVSFLFNGTHWGNNCGA